MFMQIKKLRSLTLSTLILLPVISGCQVGGSTNSQTKTQAKTKTNKKLTSTPLELRLGDPISIIGYNRPDGKCYSIVKPEEHSSQFATSADTQTILSTKDLKDSFDLAADVSVSYGLIGGNSSFSTAAKSVSNEASILIRKYFKSKFTTNMSFNQIDFTPLGLQALETFTQEFALAETDQEKDDALNNYFQVCGTGIVDTVYKGLEANAFVEITANNKQNSSSWGASLSASAGSFASMNTQMSSNSDMSSMSFNTRAHSEIYGYGGSEALTIVAKLDSLANTCKYEGGKFSDGCDKFMTAFGDESVSGDISSLAHKIEANKDLVNATEFPGYITFDKFETYLETAVQSNAAISEEQKSRNLEGLKKLKYNFNHAGVENINIYNYNKLVAIYNNYKNIYDQIQSIKQSFYSNVAGYQDLTLAKEIKLSESDFNFIQSDGDLRKAIDECSNGYCSTLNPDVAFYIKNYSENERKEDILNKFPILLSIITKLNHSAKLVPGVISINPLSQNVDLANSPDYSLIFYYNKEYQGAPNYTASNPSITTWTDTANYMRYGLNYAILNDESGKSGLSTEQIVPYYILTKDCSILHDKSDIRFAVSDSNKAVINCTDIAPASYLTINSGLKNKDNTIVPASLVTMTNSAANNSIFKIMLSNIDNPLPIDPQPQDHPGRLDVGAWPEYTSSIGGYSYGAIVSGPGSTMLYKCIKKGSFCTKSVDYSNEWIPLGPKIGNFTRHKLSFSMYIKPNTNYEFDYSSIKVGTDCSLFNRTPTSFNVDCDSSNDSSSVITKLYVKNTITRTNKELKLSNPAATSAYIREENDNSYPKCDVQEYWPSCPSGAFLFENLRTSLFQVIPQVVYLVTQSF